MFMLVYSCIVHQARNRYVTFFDVTRVVTGKKNESGSVTGSEFGDLSIYEEKILPSQITTLGSISNSYIPYIYIIYIIIIATMPAMRTRDPQQSLYNCTRQILSHDC